MKELFFAGNEVPRTWFKRLDNVKAMTFMHPCVVETTDQRRIIRKAQPTLDGGMIKFDHFEDSDGVMHVVFDRETIVIVDETIAYLEPNSDAKPKWLPSSN